MFSSDGAFRPWRRPAGTSSLPDRETALCTAFLCSSDLLQPAGQARCTVMFPSRVPLHRFLRTTGLFAGNGNVLPTSWGFLQGLTAASR